MNSAKDSVKLDLIFLIFTESNAPINLPSNCYCYCMTCSCSDIHIDLLLHHYYRVVLIVSHAYKTTIDMRR